MHRLSWLVGGILVVATGLSANGCSSSDDDAPAAGGTAGMPAGAAGAPVMAPPCADIPSLAMGSSTFTVTSPAYANCMPIPAVHTCDMKPFPQGTSPAVTWTAGPTGTMSYAVVFKDLAVLARTASTDPNYNRGYHYVMWDIPASVTSLPAAMAGGHLSTDVPGARQWSSFNDYAFFGPCPNFDPALPATYTDSYAIVVYALPVAKSTVPEPVMGISTVRQFDDAFIASALAVAEHRGTSAAHASEIPEGVLPPMAKPPCPTAGTQPEGCLPGPT